MIQHLIWDVDGTLFDTYPAIARSMQAAARDLGVAAPYDEVMRLALVSVDHCVTTLSATYALSSRRSGRTLRSALSRPSRRKISRPLPEWKRCATYIRARGGLNLIVTHRRRAGLDRLLATHRLTGYFADIISNDDAYPRKPDPAAFVALIEKTSTAA